MPTLYDVQSLKRVLGIVIYLTKFLSNLSGVHAPLSKLEKKDIARHSVNIIKECGK